MPVKRGKRSTNYFIIQYSPSWCHIVLLDTYEGIRMKEIYDYAIIRLCKKIISSDDKPDENPIIAYNDSFWWIGEAKNAGEFIKKFMSKIQESSDDSNS